jgi:hypothetical protein
MNESADGVGADDSEKPRDKQYDGNDIQHQLFSQG